jgi:hypothetical protein
VYLEFSPRKNFRGSQATSEARSHGVEAGGATNRPARQAKHRAATVSWTAMLRLHRRFSSLYVLLFVLVHSCGSTPVQRFRCVWGAGTPGAWRAGCREYLRVLLTLPKPILSVMANPLALPALLGDAAAVPISNSHLRRPRLSPGLFSRHGCFCSHRLPLLPRLTCRTLHSLSSPAKLRSVRYLTLALVAAQRCHFT